jgi:hypothetical protein
MGVLAKPPAADRRMLRGNRADGLRAFCGGLALGVTHGLKGSDRGGGEIESRAKFGFSLGQSKVFPSGVCGLSLLSV